MTQVLFRTLLLMVAFVCLPGQTTALLAQSTSSKNLSNWEAYPHNGRVRESFENAVASGQPAKDRTFFADQRLSSQSPDRKVKLAYAYEYGQPTLWVRGTVTTTNQTTAFQLPIDDGFTNHGLFVNDQGEVFLINTDANDGLYLIRYQPQTEESTILQVGPTGSRRNRFIPYFGPEGKVYVANVGESPTGQLTGVMVSVFNFAANRVEDVQFHPLSTDIKQKMHSRMPEGRYDLVSFEVKPNGERLLQLEKRNIAANTYRYNPFAVNDPANWAPRKQQVQIGERIIFRLNAEGRTISEEIMDNFKTY